MKYPFQRLADTNKPYNDRLKEAVARVIESGYYLHGPEMQAFEKELATTVGSSQAIATSNGLDSIRLIFRGLMELGRLNRGDSVMVPANTFIASLLPLTDLGLHPMPVDIDRATMNLDFEKVRSAYNNSVKGLLTVHLYGRPCCDDELFDWLKSRGVAIVEDNAQAIGATLPDGRVTGSLGTASAFSFYPAKNIGALGDAGAVTTSDAELAAVIRRLANYGSSRRYHHELCGYNNRMDELQAAMLRIKLADLQAVNSHRRKIADVYGRTIYHPAITTPQPVEGHVWHQYVITSPYRDELQEYLTREGVETLIHYPVPPHLQPCYKDLETGDLPMAEKLAKEVLSLPIANITEKEALDISGIINRFEPRRT